MDHTTAAPEAEPTDDSQPTPATAAAATLTVEREAETPAVPEPAVATEPEAESQAEPEATAGTDPEPAADTPAVPEPAAGSEPEAGPEDETEPATEPEAGGDSQPESERDDEPEAAADDRPETEADPPPTGRGAADAAAGRAALAAGLRGHALVPMVIVLTVAVLALAVVAHLPRPAAVAEADPTVPSGPAPGTTAPRGPALDDLSAVPPLPRLLPPAPPPTPVWLPPRPLAEPLSRVPTPNKVIFLGIDDGLHRDPAALDYLWVNHIPFSVFLTMGPAKEDPAFWRQVVAAGGTIESHTLTHPDLRRVGAKALQDEVCGTADVYQSMFGRRPTLFRPPFGSYDERVRRVAMSCGYQTLVMWYGSTNNGKLTMQQGSLHPGDIILLHWRPDLLDNLHDVVARCRAEGFTVARLEDYLSPGR